MAKISVAFSKSLESVLKFTCVSLFIGINLVYLLVPYIVTRIDGISNANKKAETPKNVSATHTPPSPPRLLPGLSQTVPSV